jgi:ubiquinone biosynthesis protein
MPALSLLPKRWTRYRQISRILVGHGFGFLLRQARPRWLGGRRRLEEPPPAHYLVLALEELGPTFVKLGQVLSTRPDLIPPAFVAALARLQDQVAPFPFEQARRQIETELGAPLEQLFAAFEETPLAAASLSQVHAAILSSGEEVVVKVQRPGIEATIATDLEILRGLARLAEEQLPVAELYDLCGIVEEFAHTLRGELDFRREGHNADRFRRNYAGLPFLHIPQVYWDLTTRRVLTLERIRGVKIDDITALEAAGLDRHRVAIHATEVVMQGIFEDGFFHADPHPGNFFVLPGEVIAAMDFGMVGRLSKGLRQELVRLFAVAVRLDAEGMVEQLLRMSLVEQGVDRVGLRRDLERMLVTYAGRPLKEIRAGEIIEEAMPIVFRRRLRLPAEMWLLSKMLGMLEGVGLLLDPEFDPFEVARPYAQRFLQEMFSPAAIFDAAKDSLKDWANLVLSLPTALPALVGQLRSGELTVGLEVRHVAEPLAALDALSIRLALGVLVAALLVVVALFLRPLLTVGAWWGWLLLGVGGLALLGMLAGFLWTLRRGG